jgi:hypothetical protein
MGFVAEQIVNLSRLQGQREEIDTKETLQAVRVPA